MELQQLQTELKTLHYYEGNLDGKFGKLTAKAIDNAIKSKRSLPAEWSEERRQLAAEQIVYKAYNIDAGVLDGLMGEQTRYAARVFDTMAKTGDAHPEYYWRDDKDAELAKVPTEAKPIPIQRAKWPTQREVPNFYGERGANQATLELPFVMRLDWEPGTQVHRASVHTKVLEPMRRIWTNTLSHYGYDKIVELRLDRFGGCLNVRRMRGSTAWSMHSWGIAWDVDPSRNQLQWGRDRAELDATDYDAFWSFVEAEGASSLGRVKNYDWMHFQFANFA